MTSCRRRFHAIFPTGLILLLASPLQAHPGHAGHEVGGIGWGLAHPFTGLDHLVTMLAVGLWAMQLGKRARWALPVTFGAAMALGGALGISGASLPAVEPMVLASTIALGALAAFSARLPLLLSVALVALGGIFHGQAHGQELPLAANGFAAATGFLASTILLLAAGMLCGRCLQGIAARRVQKAKLKAIPVTSKDECI